MINQDSFILIWMEQVSIKNSLCSDGEMVFENLDLRVDSGEYAVISGVYGTDKISLINVLGCLTTPQRGKYIFDYNDITMLESKNLDKLRSKNIGFMFKGLNIIDSLSVYKNIEIPLLHSDNEQKESLILEAAEAFGLKDILNKKARDIADIDRHRTALARAMVLKPTVLIADEPGENLSKQDCAKILDAIGEVNAKGTAVITFSDRAEIVERASRHIVFEKGRIMAEEVAL
ncbi:MAG: transporter ATP-binding protein [Clostridia bacterium]|jgi:putative ABC transport system ATP-binding protein|nr:transporter ATP-binding protein [Clostridia bacterium]